MDSVERIVYRFSGAELSALMQLMGLKTIDGLTVAASLPDVQVVNKLVEDGIVMPCGERTYVDSGVSLVIMAAAASRRYITVDSGECRATLYESDKLCVLMEEGRGIVKIEPLRNRMLSQKPWKNALASLDNNIKLTITVDGIANDAVCSDEFFD